MFKCKIIRQIHSGVSTASSDDVGVQKYVELPFVPFAGLNLSSDIDGFECEVKEVCFEMGEGLFHVYTESDKEIYNAKLHMKSHRDIQEIAKSYTDSGWELEE